MTEDTEPYIDAIKEHVLGLLGLLHEDLEVLPRLQASNTCGTSVETIHLRVDGDAVLVANRVLSEEVKLDNVGLNKLCTASRASVHAYITHTDVLDAKRTAAYCVGLLLRILLATSTEGQLSNDEQVTEASQYATLSIKYRAVASWRSRICDTR